jgi:hypothetical protein
MNVVWAKLLLGTANLARDRSKGGNINSSGIHWRRGLFRLWVVGSVLWIAGVVIVDGLPSKPPPWAYDPIVPPNDLITVPESTAKAPNPFDQFDDPPTAKPGLSPLPKGFVLDQVGPARPVPIGRQIWKFCLKAFGVPTGTLLAWITIAWILEGFRPSGMGKADTAQTEP